LSIHSKSLLIDEQNFSLTLKTVSSTTEKNIENNLIGNIFDPEEICLTKDVIESTVFIVQHDFEFLHCSVL
jgi:hypothetical protein